MFVSCSSGTETRLGGAGQGDEDICQRLLEGRREHIVDEQSQEVCRLWRQLDPKKSSSVHPFWTSEAADFLIPMLAAPSERRKRQGGPDVDHRERRSGDDELVYPDGRAEVRGCGGFTQVQCGRGAL